MRKFRCVCGKALEDRHKHSFDEINVLFVRLDKDSMHRFIHKNDENALERFYMHCAARIKVNPKYEYMGCFLHQFLQFLKVDYLESYKTLTDLNNRRDEE